MPPSDTPPQSDVSVAEPPKFATATEVIQAIPVTRAGVVRFTIGFFLLGFLWIGGLLVVSAIVLPQRLTDAHVPNAPAVLGAVNAFGTIFALVSNIVWGTFSDRTRSRLGRRTPWIIAGTLLAGFFLWFTGVSTIPAVIIIAFCGFQASLNMLLAPAIAVLSDRVPHLRRGVVSAAYGTGITVGAQVGILIGARFISNLAPGFIIGGVLVAISGILAVLIWPKDPSTKDLPTASRNFKDVLISLRPPTKAPDFYWAFGSRFAMLLSYQMITAYQLYIVQKYILAAHHLSAAQITAQSAGIISTMAVITLVVSLVSSVVSGPFSDLIKRRKLPVILASLLFAVGMAMPWIMPTTTGMYLFAGLAGFGFGVYVSVDQALLVDVVPNKEQAGKDLAILNMSTTAGQTVGPIITSTIVTVTGAYVLAFPTAIVFAVIGAIMVLMIKKVH
jgi:MFS family permease